YDVKCSKHVAAVVKAAGGQPLMGKTGHSLVKARMKETQAPLGGEMSGHVFFKDRWYGFDDGLYAGARLLEILSKLADPNATLNALPQSISKLGAFNLLILVWMKRSVGKKCSPSCKSSYKTAY
ncbi:MAG: hypothetical protein EBV54_08850, partial [Burkholderiaceae bacterium]|nr:hypothetical protein [Burkholderiaceae bacterium]